MKKILYSAFCLAGIAALASCGDFLETSTPSEVDAGFVFSHTETSRAALDGAYESWRGTANSVAFGDGLFYATDATGSDIERHPEGFANQLGRHYPECFYQNGTYASSYNTTSYLKDDGGPYSQFYQIISKANTVILNIKSANNFAEVLAAKTPSNMGQIYGEALALRATAYRELLKNYGDVPYISDEATNQPGLVGRDSIYDVILAELQEAAPNMYRVGSIPGVTGKNYFSRTYVEGLIGRMALEAGGYQTRRGDIKRVNGKGETLTFENIGNPNNGATYGRRSDWKSLYELARTYFKAVIDNSGSAKFITSDSRSVPNPYQVFFQQMHESDDAYADESIYEYSMVQGTHSDARSYALGRPSAGGNNMFPCKAYGQGRINPAFYYGIFDPTDMRRDVSCTVTGTKGSDGTEKLLPFTPGAQANGGGIAWNKWDENRQTKPYTTKQRLSGINGPYMRMSEMYLGYAEACAALGDNSEATTYLTKIRERVFPSGKANVAGFIASKESLLEAIIDERGFEFAGEGDRRWTLIRTGMIAKKIKTIKDLTGQMINGLEANGSYTFSNGNTISNYIWTKMVDGKSQLGYRLTEQTPAGKEDDPILSPGWRGVNNDWAAAAKACNMSEANLAKLNQDGKTNLAIKGLFKSVLPNKLTVEYTLKEKAADGSYPKETVEITTGISFDKIKELLTLTDAQKEKYSTVRVLDEEGYEATAWGIDLVKNKTEYHTNLFLDYDYVSAPIYLWPFTPNVITNGKFTNGYGFKNN